jgi:hypothetical protein
MAKDPGVTVSALERLRDAWQARLEPHAIERLTKVPKAYRHTLTSAQDFLLDGAVPALTEAVSAVLGAGLVADERPQLVRQRCATSDTALPPALQRSFVDALQRSGAGAQAALAALSLWELEALADGAADGGVAARIERRAVEALTDVCCGVVAEPWVRAASLRGVAGRADRTRGCNHRRPCWRSASAPSLWPWTRRPWQPPLLWRPRHHQRHRPRRRCKLCRSHLRWARRATPAPAPAAPSSRLRGPRARCSASRPSSRCAPAYICRTSRGGTRRHPTRQRCRRRPRARPRRGAPAPAHDCGAGCTSRRTRSRPTRRCGKRENASSFSSPRKLAHIYQQWRAGCTLALRARAGRRAGGRARPRQAARRQSLASRCCLRCR